MEILELVFGIIMLGLLGTSIYFLYQIKRRLQIMPTQEEFNAQVKSINDSIDTLVSAVTAETAQVKAFIDAHPDLDTSALDGVVSRLTDAAAGVEAIDPNAAPTPIPAP